MPILYNPSILVSPGWLIAVNGSGWVKPDKVIMDDKGWRQTKLAIMNSNTLNVCFDWRAKWLIQKPMMIL